MPIRHAVQELEKKLTGCTVIRVFEFPLEEKQEIAAQGPAPMEQCCRTIKISGRTAIQVLEAWTAIINPNTA